MQADGWDFKTCMLRLSRPLKMRIEMRVILIGLFPLPAIVGVQINKADRRIVQTVLVRVFVLFDRFLRLSRGFSRSWHI